MTTQIKRASFGATKEGNISSLPGYDRKNSRFTSGPKSASSEAFVAKLGAAKVEAEANALFDKIKTTFGYLRKEITLDCDVGSALIRAKDFDVTLSITQHPERTEEYQLLLTVDHFSTPEVVAGAPFNEIFQNRFSVLRLELSTQQNLEELIDRIEAGKVAGISCTYPRDCSRVEIHYPSQDGEFVIGKDWVEIRLLNQAPRDFVEALRKVQELRLYEDVFGSIPLAGG